MKVNEHHLLSAFVFIFAIVGVFFVTQEKQITHAQIAGTGVEDRCIELENDGDPTTNCVCSEPLNNNDVPNGTQSVVGWNPSDTTGSKSCNVVRGGGLTFDGDRNVKTVLATNMPAGNTIDFVSQFDWNNGGAQFFINGQESGFSSSVQRTCVRYYKRVSKNFFVEGDQAGGCPVASTKNFTWNATGGGNMQMVPSAKGGCSGPHNGYGNYYNTPSGSGDTDFGYFDVSPGDCQDNWCRIEMCASGDLRNGKNIYIDAQIIPVDGIRNEQAPIFGIDVHYSNSSCPDPSGTNSVPGTNSFSDLGVCGNAQNFSGGLRNVTANFYHGDVGSDGYDLNSTNINGPFTPSDPGGPDWFQVSHFMQATWTVDDTANPQFIGPACEIEPNAFECSSFTQPTQNCNNGVREGSEVCDQTDLNSQSCTTISGGFDGGTLTCSSSCTFDTSLCTTTTPPTQTCNNDTLEGSEVCDQNQLNGQTCQLQGFDDGPLSCNNSCDGFDTGSCTTSGGEPDPGGEPGDDGVLRYSFSYEAAPPDTATLIIIDAQWDVEVMLTATINIDANGVFILPSGLLPANKYNFKIVADGYLDKVYFDIGYGLEDFVIRTELHIAGDLNGDNVINTLDWSEMNPVWFTNNALADLNNDGIVNTIDFSFLATNWFSVGD